MQSSKLRQLSGLNEYFKGVMFMPTAKCDAFSLAGFSEWFTLNY